MLSDTSRRIGAMGAAQQVFYSVRNSTDISGQSFIEAVCANARAFFSNDVSINYEATAGSLPKETAVPLALALNELLTNAAKYGANERGRVTINVGTVPACGRDRTLCAGPRTGFQLAGRPSTVIRSWPGNDVGAAAQRNLHGGTKVRCALHF